MFFFFFKINMFWALSNDIDLVENHEYHVLGQVFIILEAVLLMLPLVIAFGYVLCKVIKFLWTLIVEACSS